METLVAVLLSVLSVTLLLAGIAASAQIGRTAEASDAAFYAQLSAAEGQTEDGPSSGTAITVTLDPEKVSAGDIKIPASLYGGGDLWAYARSEAGGATP